MSIKPIVDPVSDDAVKGATKDLFEKMSQMPGGVPKWMRVMANCDDILLPFFGMFKATMDDSPLDAKLKWKLALYVSKINECDYCVDVSESKLRSLGFSDDELKTMAEEISNNRERLAFKFAESATKHAYNMGEDLVSEVKKEFSDAELVELAAVVGLFNYINRFNDALNILPDLK